MALFCATSIYLKISYYIKWTRRNIFFTSYAVQYMYCTKGSVKNMPLYTYVYSWHIIRKKLVLPPDRKHGSTRVPVMSSKLCDIAHDGVLFMSVIDQPQTGTSGVVRQGRRHGPSIMYKITPCWVILQPAKQAAALGRPSSLHPPPSRIPWTWRFSRFCCRDEGKRERQIERQIE